MKKVEVTPKYTDGTILTDEQIIAAFHEHPDFAAHPEALDYLHKEKRIADIIRQEGASLLEFFIASWIAQTKADKIEAAAEERYQEFKQKCEASDQRVRELQGWAIKFMCPDAYLNSLPTVMHGFTQGEAGYWLEPAVQGRKDSEPLHYEVPSYETRLGPRFLPGCRIEVEEVLSGEALQEGGIYYHESEGLFRLGKQAPIATRGTARGKIRHYMMRDAEPCPEYAIPAVCHTLDIAWATSAGRKLYRFLDYVSVADVNPPTWVHDQTRWERKYQSYEEMRAQTNRRNAQRRERDAQRKQPKAAQPLLGFRKVKPMPAGVGCFPQRKAA